MAIKKVVKKPAPKKVVVAKKKVPVTAKKVIKAPIKAPVKAPIKKMVPVKAPPVKAAPVVAPKKKVVRKPGRVQTAEGWKRVMVNKLGKKRPGKSLT